MTPEVKERIEQIRQGIVPQRYKRTKTAIVPTQWNECAIGDFATVSQGFTFSRDYQGNSSGKWNYFKVADIGLESNGKYLAKALNTISDEVMHRIGCVPFKAGSIVFPRVGAALLNNNKKLLAQDSVVDDNVLALRITSEDVCDCEYLYYALQNVRLEEWCNSGLVPVINTKTVCKYSISLPPIQEQYRIAEILSAQDKGIELKERLLAEKQQQKKYLMQQLLTGKKRLPGFDGEWKSEKLSDFCDFVGGGTPDTKKPKYWNGAIPWISSSDLEMDNFRDIAITRYISEDAIRESSTKRCKAGTILLVSRVGVGKIAMAPVELCTSQDFTNLVQQKHNATFLMYSLYLLMQTKIKQVQGSAIKGIPTKEIKEYSLSFPEMEEQNAIAERLATADLEIDLLKQDIEQEKQKKKALMQLLLTGIVRV